MTYKTLFFDLDDTIYSHDSGVWKAIRDRIDLFLHEKMHFSISEIPEIRATYFNRYGTTLRGLQALHNVNTRDYLDFVHDVPVSDFLEPDPELRAMLLSYPQRKLIFTNADVNHAKRVLAALGIEACFEQIIDVLDISPHCKPDKEAFEKALQLARIDDATTCVFLDDSPRNLATAKECGFYTIKVGEKNGSGQYHTHINTIQQLPQVLSVE
jgi:pyrimidine 5'-nucleotidase